MIWYLELFSILNKVYIDIVIIIKYYVKCYMECYKGLLFLFLKNCYSLFFGVFFFKFKV